MKPTRIAAVALILLIALQAAAQTSLIEQGKSALKEGQLDSAVALFQKAVAEQPDSADAHFWLGTSYGLKAQKASIFRRMSLARRTRSEFERAVQLDPNDLDARYALVQYYTMAPGYLGGSQARARQQAAEISSRDAQLGQKAMAFIQSHGDRAQPTDSAAQR